jgi:hypothetical protein
VAGDFGVGGSFLEGGNEELGGFHGLKVTGFVINKSRNGPAYAEKRGLVLCMPPVQ